MALETRNNGIMTTYLQIDYTRGSLYVYSKDEKDGYEKHVSTKGNVSYRMYVNAVTGVIQTAYIRDSKFGGKDFILTLSDGDERYSIIFPQADSAYQSLAKLLPNIDVSKLVRISVYNAEYNGKTYLNVSVSYPNELNDEGKATMVKWEDLPKAKQRPSGKWDFGDVEEEAFMRGKRFVEENKFDEKNNTSSDKQENVQTIQQESDVEEDVDLPF